LMGKWKKDLVSSKDVPFLTWLCITNALLVGSMCIILVPSRTVYSTKVT
jgi:hypothetical protein